MNMSTWAIRNPVPPLAAFLVLLVIGLFSFTQLPVTRFPNIDVPIITVTSAQPGAAPSEIVTQVTEPIEDAIAGITGVKHITSTASDSLSAITVEFELETDSDRALNDVKDAVARVRGDLPDGVQEPIVRRLDITGAPILTYAVSDPTRGIEDVSWFVDDVVSRELQGIDGLGQISRLGGADREIKVELDPDRLLALGITAAEISRQLRATNIDLGGGRGDIGGQEFSIRALGGATTVAELAATPLALAGGRTVRLSDLGQVIDGASEVRQFATMDGEPVVAFGVLRATGASDLEVGKAVKERVAQIEAEHPEVRMTLIDDTTDYTEGNYRSAMETLFEGAALAIIVVFLFLRSWRATLITAIALPLSIIPTFFAMQWLGFSLNTVSLLGITLVTGILVDDAIVEIENIERHIDMGKPAYEATEEAAGEIGLIVVAISFTIVAVFAPVSFMSGIAGQYFRQFGLTVAIAVLFSLAVARLVTPLLAAYFLRARADDHEVKTDSWLMRRYVRMLAWTLRNRTVTLIAGLLIFAGSIYSATLLPGEFIPPADEGRVIVSVELPPGGTLSDTRAVTDTIAARMGTVPEVLSVFVEGGTDDITTARVTANLGPKGDRDRSSFEIEDELKGMLADIPDARVNFLAGNGQRDVVLYVLGDDAEKTAAAAETVSDAMRSLPDLRNVTNAASLRRPELRITPRPDIAAELGVTASDLASTILVATIGDSDAALAKFSIDGRQIPVVVRVAERFRRDLERLGAQRVPTATGAQVPLGVVADLSLASGPSTIERYDRRTRVAIEADLAPGTVLGPAVAAIQALPEARDMQGAELQTAGDAEVMGEVFASFGQAMGAGLLLVYVVLVLLFNSFVTPFTILLSLPLAIGGAIFALWLTGSAISLPVVIGFLMLMGIVTKNAIMLVEFALEAMSNGADKFEAMRDAGHKRARPIVMTTIAMAAGMIPSALALGAGGEFRAPMAIAVIGGLLLSTVLTLVFIPSLFTVINAGRTRVRGAMMRRLGLNRPQAQAQAGE